MITLITGGIGSGKSVVSRVLRAMGYTVYDCDSRAKALMDGSAEIHRRLASEISPSTLNADGTINRPELSRLVFGDASRLAVLNSIVHGAVFDDIRAVHAAMSEGETLYVETAIPVSSGMDRMADRVWEVTAPEHLRIERVERRSGLNLDQIRARIEAQRSEAVPGAAVIVNDGLEPLLPQIEDLLQ